MVNYTPVSPTWSDSIQITDTSTPNNGDLIARPDKALMDNVVILNNKKADKEIVDDTTEDKYILGIDNGLLYYEEVEEEETP